MMRSMLLAGWLALGSVACGGDGSGSATGPSGPAGRDAVTGIVVSADRGAVLPMDGQHAFQTTVSFTRVAGAVTGVTFMVCLSERAEPRDAGGAVQPHCRAAASRTRSPISVALNNVLSTWPATAGDPQPLVYRYVHALMYEGELPITAEGRPAFVAPQPVHTLTIEWPTTLMPVLR